MVAAGDGPTTAVAVATATGRTAGTTVTTVIGGRTTQTPNGLRQY